VGQGAGFPVVAGMLNFRRSNGFWGWVEQEMKGYFCLCIKICFNLI
jgi:NAD-dependent SIR2 family protein deacetylase